ncbi:MAG TPA: GIY-YIG nuclease family protein [Phycisphaerae bacterium]|nr:GIY-YIG nuclease family protein [Phycisphaerae bacterium]
MYILRCSDGSLYTGATTDVKRRSEQHNAGTASRYTRCRLPVRVVYQEPHASRSLALKREWAVKAMTRLEKKALIRWGARRSRYFPMIAYRKSGIDQHSPHR